jgi:feruloyl esterase
MRTLVSAAIAVLTLPTVLTPLVASVPMAAPAPCDGLTAIALPHTTITSAAVVPASDTLPATCRVHATVTHPPAGDTVNIDVWMPVDGWNGRFQGVGGGGYVGGSPLSLAARPSLSAECRSTTPATCARWPAPAGPS